MSNTSPRHRSVARGARLVMALGLCAGLITQTGCKNITEGQAEPGTIGAACTEAGDCDQVDSPTCLKMPDGYCSTDCAGGGFLDCDTQSICDQLGDQAFFCLDGCLTDNGNDDCRDQYRCSGRPDVSNFDGREVGVCVPTCQSDGDCEAGRRCDTNSGNCVQRGQVSTGGACSNNNSCNGGLCITADTFRGGYCSARCGNQFEGCEPGSQCTELFGESVCLSSCSSDGDCRDGEGYKCRQIGTRKNQDGDDVAVRVCVPRCQSNDECEDGFHCDAGSGDCIAGAADPNPLGSFCDGDGDCESGDCITDGDWPRGYCTSSCNDCEGVCGSTPSGDSCLLACDGDLDCRPGYVCSEGGCTAPCGGDADCGDGLSCNRSSGRCVVPSAAGAEQEVVEIASGVSVEGQLSNELTVTVPEGTQGFSILADGHGSDLMIIGEMRDPNGRKIYDFQDPFNSEVRFFPSDDIITQTVPTSPRSAPIAGDYTFRLIKDGGRKSVDVRALIKTADGDLSDATVDVNFVFARLNGGLDAASAPGDDKFQEAEQGLRELFASQGVTVGEVSYCDLSGSDLDKFAVVDSVDGPSSELGQMFSRSGDVSALGCKEGGLNFFLVQEIVGGRAGYIILGIAGGIPGPPPGINGTSHSGVAVTMAGYTRNPRQLAQTMAHEGGHFLGLFHTTEAEGTAFDPLADTPECPNNKDRNGDGIVSYEECLDGNGGRNLMFWAAGAEAETVTNDQGFVLIRNPGLK